MTLYTLVDWAFVVGTFALTATGIGLAVGWVFCLTHRVAQLEGFANEVSFELVAKEQARDVQLMRERMDLIQFELLESMQSKLDAVAADSGQAAA